MKRPLDKFVSHAFSLFAPISTRTIWCCISVRFCASYWQSIVDNEKMRYTYINSDVVKDRACFVLVSTCAVYQTNAYNLYYGTRCIGFHRYTKHRYDTIIGEHIPVSDTYRVSVLSPTEYSFELFWFLTMTDYSFELFGF